MAREMRNYEVDLTVNGVTSAIDAIVAPASYTPEDYYNDCVENGDQEWVDMLDTGKITLVMC